jgi:hypothetical protein
MNRCAFAGEHNKSRQWWELYPTTATTLAENIARLALAEIAAERSAINPLHIFMRKQVDCRRGAGEREGFFTIGYELLDLFKVMCVARIGVNPVRTNVVLTPHFITWAAVLLS